MIGRLGIRARIAGGSVLIAALLALAAGLVINAQIERIVRDGTVDVLESDASFYVTAIRNEPGESFDRPGPGQLVAVVDPSGAMPLSTLPRDLRASVAELVRHGESQHIRAGGVDYIVRTEPVRSSSGLFHVIAARTADSELTVVTQMRVLLIVGLSAIVVAIAITAWLLTAASLAPVRRLRSTAERLSTSGSDELLPVGAARDDVQALAITLNGLIERLRDAADRERQLVSDASHELRTPLAILRAQLEVATAAPSDLASLRDDLEPVEQSAERLSRLIVSLLELSRIESAGARDALTIGAVLVDEIDETVERAGYRLDEGTQIELVRESIGEADASFAISPEDVGRIVDNLLTNSIRALRQAGEVRVRSVLDEAELLLQVSDTGGGMSEEFLPHALERFRREDEARTSDGGAGLGLPIVAAIVHRSGGTIRLENDPERGLAVTMRLPAVAVAVAEGG